MCVRVLPCRSNCGAGLAAYGPTPQYVENNTLGDIAVYLPAWSKKIAQQTLGEELKSQMADTPKASCGDSVSLFDDVRSLWRCQLVQNA